ncbi:E3 ubiquitin-protein ligase HAKAI homolog isoform X1 [Salvia splendens]|uniref:E3 ubiquitin-protein ligase HAKAI homolog isoform X1 n=1 Tax=Salvia splendens TaxID=180675 RepID=UPI001C27D255|nr:E3 ubiquitin-protein ligase HAKAI homolog isoform X1 [Salvia splendens]XP_042030829.1 E3 ubiquitin-protein ligase HAKAI homolog isoform X1 [Salvia splendens]
MLQIRLSKPASEAGAAANPAPVDTVTVACPDHLVLADLTVAKGMGAASATAVIKSVGRRSRRQLGERVHFCVRCDFPVAIYGRLSPCEHAFCLDCSRSHSLCYLCDERIQKIQTIKMMEGIFICAAPHCLKSFLKKSDFELHINEAHSDLIHPNKEKEGNESEAMSARKPSASDSSVQAPPRPVFSPHSSSQLHDSEDKAQLPQSREQPPARPAVQQRPAPPFPRQTPDHPSEHPDRGTSQNHFPQHTFEAHVQGSGRQDSVNPNSGPTPPQYDYPPYAADGTQQYFGAPYGMPRPGSTPEGGPGQGTLLGFPPGPAGPMNFPQNYPQWNAVPGSVPLEPPMVSHRSTDGFMNVNSQGRGFFQNAGNNSMEQQRQGGNFVDPRNGKGILAPQPPHLPPPPSVPHPHLQWGRSHSGDGNHDGRPGFSWPTERRDSFGSGD